MPLEWHSIKLVKLARNANDSLELAYADDLDFVSRTNFKDVDEIQKISCNVNFHVNASKKTSLPLIVTKTSTVRK